MKRLYDWFWERMDEQKGRGGQQALANLFGYAVLVFGLLMLWLIVTVCDWLGLNN